jgi:NADP-dependent 3-hydroxy acid dehydrogenase YdfG
MDYKEVWLITGASTGSGRYLTEGLLQNGHRVAAVSQDLGPSTPDKGPALSPDKGSTILAREPWEDLIRSRTGAEENLLSLTTDLTSEDSVRSAIRQTVLQFGRIDVVVNYAGHDLPGPIETLSICVIHRLFEENVFGSFHVLKQVMPYLRNQGSGKILTYLSPAAVAAAAGSPLYAATQLAIESLSEELMAGMETLGIQQALIRPGAFWQKGKEVFPPNSEATYRKQKQAIHQTAF